MKANKKRKKKIYRLQNGTIEIYNFEPIRSRIAYFRLKEMKKIDENEQIVIKDYNPNWFSSKKNIVFRCGGYNIRLLPPKDFNEIEDNDLLLKRFIEGGFRDGSIHVRNRDDEEGEKIFYLNPKAVDTNKNIQVTPAIYLEYLLENEYFSAKALQEENLSKERDLFHISKEPIMECSLESFETILRSGLISGNYDDTLKLIECSTKVYEKLKKPKKKTI